MVLEILFFKDFDGFTNGFLLVLLFRVVVVIPEVEGLEVLDGGVELVVVGFVEVLGVGVLFVRQHGARGDLLGKEKVGLLQGRHDGEGRIGLQMLFN